MTWLGIEPIIYCTGDEHANHYTTDAIPCKKRTIVLKILTKTIFQTVTTWSLLMYWVTQSNIKDIDVATKSNGRLDFFTVFPVGPSFDNTTGKTYKIETDDVI